MIHFLTVHITDIWIHTQEKFIKRYVPSSKIYAYIPSGIKTPFDSFPITNEVRCNVKECEHRAMLVRLANQFLNKVPQEDIVCLIDSDAFPIDDKFESYIAENLKAFQIVAIERIELKRPHVAFMSMTLQNYRNIFGKVVGINTLELGHSFKKIKKDVITAGLAWHKIPCCNPRAKHGKIFGGIVYHYVAGTEMKKAPEFDFDSFSKVSNFSQPKIDNALLHRIYLTGSDNLRVFGGLYQGAYYLQQVPEEAAEFIMLCREQGRKNPRFLEIGSAAGGFAKLLDDELVCRSIRICDDNKHPNAKWRKLRLPHVTAEYIGDAADAQSWLTAQNDQYDLMLIDTNHVYENEKRCTEVALPYLAPGGLLAYHDTLVTDVKKLVHEMKNGLYSDLEHIADIGNRLGISVFRKKGLPELLPDYKPPSATLLYHFCPWTNRPEIIEFHLKRLGYYLPQFSKVRINIVTGNNFAPPEQIEKQLLKSITTNDVQFYHTPNSSNGEVYSFFNNLLPTVESDENVCYGHTKAAMHTNLPRGEAWAAMMYAHNMQNSRAAIALLKTYTCVGTFKRNLEWKESHWHYAGTFFWFRNVQQWLNHKQHKDSRFGVEQWLGSFVPNEQALDVHGWPFMQNFMNNNLKKYLSLPQW